MDLEQKIKTDPTWKKSLEIASSLIALPDHVLNLFRSGWRGRLEEDEFIKTLGFTRLNPACLFRAANQDVAHGGNVSDLEDAIAELGVRYSALVLAVGRACLLVLRRNPPSLWQEVLKEMMTCIEVGFRMGSRLPEIGYEGGAAIGFAQQLGHAILLASDPDHYIRWTEKPEEERKRPEYQIDMFGCEPYQVAALGLQRLGFGTELAMGAALLNGKVRRDEFGLEPRILRWKAAGLWLQALRMGRDYPANVEIRNYFDEISPPTERDQKNLTLQVLYTEVARVRSQGSQWNWHLPREGYEESLDFVRSL